MAKEVILLSSSQKNIEKKLGLLNLMSLYYNLGLRKTDVSDYVTRAITFYIKRYLTKQIVGKGFSMNSTALKVSKFKYTLSLLMNAISIYPHMQQMHFYTFNLNPDKQNSLSFFIDKFRHLAHTFSIYLHHNNQVLHNLHGK